MSDNIENVPFYNRIFDLYEMEIEIGDLKNIDGDYLVRAVYEYLKGHAKDIDDGSIMIWLYKIYGADKKTMVDRFIRLPNINNILPDKRLDF